MFTLNELINVPEVDYNTCAKLLFKLAHQVLDKFKTYLNEDEIKNVVQYHKRDIANFIKPQLMENFKKEVTKFEAPDVRAFSQILEHNSYKFLQDEIYDFRETIEPANKIKSLMFTGFKKACHKSYKFDSKTEKDFAIILEDDSQVEKWLRPASNQFRITQCDIARYYIIIRIVYGLFKCFHSLSSGIGMRVTSKIPSEVAARRIFSTQHQIDANSFKELKEDGCV